MFSDQIEMQYQVAKWSHDAFNTTEDLEALQVLQFGVTIPIWSIIIYGRMFLICV